MNDNNLLAAASSRIALAGLLHDIGKFAERAKIDLSDEQKNSNRHLYCKRHPAGYLTHHHAAYTGAAIDAIDKYLPPLKKTDLFPFEADDSLINAAAGHHHPHTFLQWVIATADRMASGFEREEFEKYNQAEEGTSTKKNHYTARQLTLFEQVFNIGKQTPTSLQYRYPLKALSPDSIFPIPAADYETDHQETAQQEYRQLWDEFVLALQEIPTSHRHSLGLWLDHFDTLWLTYTQAIPSATAFNVKPDVSLYDHSKSVTALATALWRYHHEREDDQQQAAQAMKTRSDWKEHKFLLIQGDFFGIQEFIFTDGSDTQKHAAKLLRGRSFYLSLLVECAALKILQTLELPSTSQITNAAGKFLIVAPNTTNTKQKLAQVKAELNHWFLQHSYGQAGIGLAYTPACCDDFSHKHFRKLQKRLFEQLEISKLQRFELTDNTPSVFADYLDSFNNQLGICKINGRHPATEKNGYSQMAADQITTGEQLTKAQRLLISRTSLNSNSLQLPIFGYSIYFTDNEAASGKFGNQISNGNLLRAWDFSLPEFDNTALWNGYARRYINGYVATFDHTNDSDLEKYARWQDDAVFDRKVPIKTLNHLACENRILDKQGNYIGQIALTTLKGDIDDLGLIMRSGLQGELSFAKMAGLSRQFNFFFAIYLPWLCQQEFPDTYTVFAGGDDFFLIGPWHSQIKLAQRLQQEFTRYVATNPKIHFSVGLSMHKPGLPVRQLAQQAEAALEQAKGTDQATPKNAVVCFGQRVDWQQFEQLINHSERLDQLQQNYDLSTGYIYGLIHLCDKAASQKPEDAIWRSWLHYRTRRFVIDKLKKINETCRHRIHTELVNDVGEQGIASHRQAYKIALFTHLYRLRK